MILMSVLNGSRKTLLIVFLVVVAGIFFGGEYIGLDVYGWLKSAADDDVEYAEVTKGPFKIAIVVPGELAAHQSEIITVPTSIRSNLLIVDMVPEGYEVEAGDFLVKFDTAELENDLLEREEQLAVQNQELEELIIRQESDAIQRDAQLQINLLSFEQKQLTHQSAKYESPNRQRQMEIDMMKAEYQLENQKRTIQRQEDNAKKQLQRKRDQIQRTKDNIADILEQIEESVLYAPIPGLVVYRKTYSGGEEVKIKVGDTARRRQELIELPDLSEMRVKTAINEVDISKVKLKQNVTITFDFDENLAAYGTVLSVSKLARRESSGLGNRVKVFDVEVAIEETDESMRPGMTTTCQIFTESLDDVMFIPLQSVFRDVEKGEFFVYVKNGSSWEKTIVMPGAKNKDYQVIEDGLEVGDLVALRDPFVPLTEIGTDIKKAAQPQGGGVQPQVQPQPDTRQLYQEMMRRGGGMGGGNRGRGRGGDDIHR